MDLDRPHFRTTSTGSSTTTTTTSELFICFTSRLSSSSSMKLTKSILSPGRAARDGGGGGPASLSSSLSRRLRTNGSLKGGASPFFTTTGKKRGCAFENPEPSSPKVTCIGQVRVKTKKKVKQSRSLSKRRSGEASFRKIEHQGSASGSGDGGAGHHQSEQQRYSNASGAHYQQQQQQQECQPHRSQRWVHLPISICEALSCLFPCKSSCFSTEKAADNEKQSENGCGAVFARWLVSVNDGEGGKRREIELVVGGGDEAEEMAERVSMRSSRRHVFEDIEVKDDRIEVKGMNVEDGEEEAARVSICIPPKNALLLMRCRSDPMKMADLATRFSWDAHAAAALQTENHEDIEEEENEVVSEEQDVAVVSGVQEQCEGNEDGVFEEENVAVLVEESNYEEEQEIVINEASEPNLEMEVLGDSIVNEEDIKDEELVIISSEKIVEEEEQEIEDEEQDDEEEVESNMSSFEHLLDHQENVEDCPIQDIKEEIEDNSNSICHLSPPTESDDEENLESNYLEAANDETEATEESNIVVDPEKVAILVNDGEEFQVKIEPAETTHTENGEQEEEEEQLTTTLLPIESEMVDEPENQEPAATTVEEEPKKKAKDRSQMLPECLLLMMCEPKLSMEVSKETWVCSTDFVRWLPERPRKHLAKATAKAGGACDHAPAKRRLSVDSRLKPVTTHRAAAVADQNGYLQPPRSSCTLPAAAAAASMASMIEQKLVNAVGYEPFVLTRCKSEPMKTAAAKLLPESCFWKNAVGKLEPHRQAALGVGAAGVGF